MRKTTTLFKRLQEKYAEAYSAGRALHNPGRRGRTPPGVPAAPSVAPHTGLILDALGLDLQRAMAPRILDVDHVGDPEFPPPTLAEGRGDELGGGEEDEVELSGGEQPVAVFVPWQGSATFQRLDAFCRGVVDGLDSILKNGHPIVLAGDGDVGGGVGERFGRRFGGEDGVAGGFEDLLTEVELIGVVFDEQNGGHYSN